MRLIKKNWAIIMILLLAVVLRFYSLATNPPHLTPDEAALGYNAYSILKTGRDEYGEFLPIVFKSFGDFKPGFYIYATVPFVAIFGLNEFSVRAVSATAGVIAVYLLFFVVRELFKSKKRDSSQLLSTNYILLAHFSALILAISPWHIHFSRGAWEVNLALTFALAGMYFFLKTFDKSKWLVLSAFFFGLSLITYQGAKMSVALVVVLLAILYWKQVWRVNRKTLILSGVVGAIVSIPIIMSFFTGQTGRLKVFSVFSYRRPEEYLEQHLNLAEVEFGSSKYYLYYSEVENMTRGIAGRWFNHFSTRFLLFDGDWANPRHSSPDHGQLLLADIIFLVLGIGLLSKSWKNKGAKFILLWLILSPLPSALSRDQVHAVRSLNMVVPLTVAIAAGLTLFVAWMGRQGRLEKLGIIGVGGIYFVSLLYFLDSYFVHQPIHNSQYWEYGYKQVVERVTPIQDNYHTVHVRQSFAQPYIYFLFYQKYDPATYQKNAHLIESEYGDVGRVEELDNIRFLPIDWTVNRGDFGTLFVADPIRIPPEDSSNTDEFRVVDEIMYLDGKETAFRLVEVLDKDNVNKHE